MADEKTQVLLDVKVETDQSVKNIAELKESIKTLKEQQNKLKEAGKENSEEYVVLGEKIKALNKAVSANSKAVQDNIKINTSLEGSYNQLSAQLARLKEAYHEAGTDEDRQAILENLTQVDQRLKELDKEQGVYVRNVGNYASAVEGFQGQLESLAGSNSKIIGTLQQIDKAVPKTKDGFKAAGEAAKGFGKQLLALMANPIVLIISAIVLAVKQLVDAFKRNSDAMTMVEKAAAPLKAILQAIQRAFDDIVSAVVDMANELKKVFGDFDLFAVLMKPINYEIAKMRAHFAILATIMKNVVNLLVKFRERMDEAAKDSKFIKFIVDLRNKIKELVDTALSYIEKFANSDIGKMLGLDVLLKQLKEIAGTDEELIRLNREIADIKRAAQKEEAANLQANADAELKIAQLKSKVAEKDKYSSEERLAMLEEASRLEQQIADRNYSLAKKKYDLIVKENTLTGSNAENEKEQAQAYAEMVRAQTSAFEKQKELNTRMATFRKELEADAEGVAGLDEAIKKNQEIQRMAEDFALSLIQDKNAKEIAAMMLTGQREIEELKNRLATEEDLTAESRETLAQLIADKEQKLMDDIADLQEKQAEELGKKDAESARKTAELRAEAAKDGSEEEYQAKRELLDMQMQEELDNAELTEEQKMLIKQKYLEQMENLDKQWADSLVANTQSAMKEAEQVAGNAVNYAKQAAQIVSDVFSAINTAENADLENYKSQNENKEKILKARLDSGVISQREYEEQVTELNEAQAQKEKELQMKQAKRSKAMAIMNATLNAAGAIIASLAQAPVAIGPVPNPAGIASLALATATGAAQIAIAAATPLPKASRGALLKGPSHAQGGIPIEAEGGEAIINKKATARFLPLLSSINQSTGGVPLYGNGGVTGSRQVAQADLIDYNALAVACSQISVQVAVTDINTGQGNYAKVEQLRTY